MDKEALLPTGIAARRLGLSRERILQLCKSGALAHIRDVYGRCLISAEKVEDLRRQRERVTRRGPRGNIAL